MPTPLVRTFWHGPPLSYYHRACLASFVSKGVGVELFAYDARLQVPAGVVVRDAREILDDSGLQGGMGRTRAGQHSNRFRYALLHRLGGWWVDTDVMLLGDTLPSGDHFVAHYDPKGLNTAVLAFPAGSPVTQRAIAAYEAHIATEPKPRWGALGPDLITRVIRDLGLQHTSQPAETTYPIHWLELILMLDPKRRAEAEAKCARASFLHLWDGWWRDCGIPMEFRPPPGSFLDSLIPDTVPRDDTFRRMTISEAHIWCRNRAAVEEAGRLRALLQARDGRVASKV